MLQAIRDGVKGWIAWAVIGLIALPFVFMGGYDYFSGGSGGDTVVAKVGGEKIVRHELERAVEQRRMRLREVFGGDLPEGVFDEDSMRREALQGLIDERLLHRFVAAKNLRVSDAEVARNIRNQDIFHEGGQFSRDRYRLLLQRNGMAPEQYEGLVRQDLKVGQFEAALRASSFLAPGQVERFISVDRERRSFDYLEIPVDSFADEVEITEAEVRSYYAENKEDYMAPEAVKLAYIEVSEDELDDAGKIDEMANVAFEKPQSLEPAAQVVGRQVRQSGWITREGGAGGLARYSQIVEAAFSQEVLADGYNSDLLEVAEGRYFVVRKSEHRSAQPKPLAAVQAEVRQQLRLERAFGLAEQEAAQVVNSLQTGEKVLGDHAERLGVELFSVDDVLRRDVGHPRPVVRQAFAIATGEADTAALDKEAIAVVRLNEVKPGDPGQMQEERLQQVSRQLERKTASEEMQAFIMALREDLSIKINEQRL